MRMIQVGFESLRFSYLIEGMWWKGLMAAGCALALSACSGSSTGGSKEAVYHPDVGPFDIDGNYVEALADAPVKKNYFARAKSKPKTSSRKSQPRRIAKRDQEESAVAAAAPSPGSRTVVSRRVVGSRVITPEPPRSIVIASQSSGGSIPRLAAVPRTGSTTPRAPQPPERASPVSVAPRAEAVLVKPKSKPPLVHRIKSSDTLFSLSRRYGKSINSLKRANGLRSNTIITGGTLIIPQ